MTSSSRASVKKLGVFSIVMMTVGSVDSIRNLSTTALFGSSLIFFFLLAAVCFLLPSAFVSAELASSYEDSGGIYLWVKEAFGTRWGFLAVWAQWAENIFYYPAILAFMAGTIGYLISPELANNKYFIMTVVLAAFWGATWVNLCGIQASSRLASICAIFGLIVPMVLIIVLGGVWVLTHQPLAVDLHFRNLMPDLHQKAMWVPLTAIILCFCGMEIATVHSSDVHNAKKTYPKALLISTIILLVTLMGGSLAIALVVPTAKISLVTGIIEMVAIFFNHYHLHWLLPIVAALVVLGVFGTVNNWIIAPTRGLYVAGLDGCLPKSLLVVNKTQAPSRLLIIQAVLVTCLTMAFVLIPTVNGAYWFMTVLCTQIYMVMYIIMFLACWALRVRYPNKVRDFKIPGGQVGCVVFVLLGLISAIGTLVVSFIPPAHINVGGHDRYELLLIGGLCLMLLPACVKFKRK